MVQKKSKKVLIIYSNFYNEISDNLLHGAESFLKNKKVPYEKKKVLGSLEIPFLLNRFFNEYAGFVVLGCIIKGETDHYQVVKDLCYEKVYSLAYKKSLPLGSAILTVNNYKQALERSLHNKMNLGEKAAMVCCDLMSQL